MDLFLNEVINEKKENVRIKFPLNNLLSNF